MTVLTTLVATGIISCLLWVMLKYLSQAAVYIIPILTALVAAFLPIHGIAESSPEIYFGAIGALGFVGSIFTVMAMFAADVYGINKKIQQGLDEHARRLEEVSELNSTAPQSATAKVQSG